ncbi:Hypothetical protein PENO1_072120 [Penicillium occitanis (nom. inval.)]|nr:Hypothetical protein PENO1_072120 [Penicillium occitanis (nom. inval.)]PCG95911.1 hypothetical protein PENOC_075550 [Penicillium occitanis (nom. inval.)]
MLQHILSSDDIWPGGIPSTVRLHPTDEWSEDELKEESKGWCQFVEKEWIPKTDLNEEMQQRRALIERWASADQHFRDSYHRRAPLRDSSLDSPPNLLPKYLAHQKRFICLAPVDREKHSENYKRLLQVLILLYNHENRSLDHPMAHYTNWDPCHIPAIIVDPSFTDTADDPSFSMDIDQPLIGILDSAHQRGELFFDEYSPDDWARQLEAFAPGYLDLDAQDREADFDQINLWDPKPETYVLNVPPRLRMPGIEKNLSFIGGIDRHADNSREYSLEKFFQS